MRQKAIRVYHNPEKGPRIVVCWGGSHENVYEDIAKAAVALGCAPEWLERRMQAAFLPTLGLSELDLYWDEGRWNAPGLEPMFHVGERVSLVGEIVEIDSKAGEVTVRLDGVPIPVKGIDQHMLNGLRLSESD